MIKKLLFLLCAAVSVLILPSCSKPPEDTRPVITIASDPAGAEVYINNRKYGKSPLSGKIAPGNYLIRVEMPGFETAWKKVELEPRDKKQCDFTLNKTRTGVLITSTPKSGAQVTFNDQAAGQTPLIISGLEPGKYFAIVKSPRYAGVRVEWEIKDERPVLVRANLLSNVGKISITCQPDAEILMDGEVFGQTPITNREIEEGEHVLEIRKQGYAIEKTTVAVTRSETLKKDFVLKELLSGLDITSVPSGAEVELDGEICGNTPVKVGDLKAGEHKLVFRMKNYDDTKVKVTTAPGQTAQVKGDLINIFGAVEFVTIPAGIKVYVDGKDALVSEPDPDNPEVSKAMRISGLKPGEHKLLFTHPLADKPVTQKVMVVKNELTPLQAPVSMWLKTHRVYMKGGEVREVRVLFETDKGIKCEPMRGIRDFYKRSEIKKMEPLEVKEK